MQLGNEGGVARLKWAVPLLNTSSLGSERGLEVLLVEKCNVECVTNFSAQDGPQQAHMILTGRAHHSLDKEEGRWVKGAGHQTHKHTSENVESVYSM